MIKVFDVTDNGTKLANQIVIGFSLDVRPNGPGRENNLAVYMVRRFADSDEDDAPPTKQTAVFLMQTGPLCCATCGAAIAALKQQPPETVSPIRAVVPSGSTTPSPSSAAAVPAGHTTG